jgi:hypothetical protein
MRIANSNPGRAHGEEAAVSRCKRSSQAGVDPAAAFTYSDARPKTATASGPQLPATLPPVQLSENAVRAL